MPATSAAQYRLMQGIAHGSIAPKGGLTPGKAAEFVSGQSPKGLPERKSGSKTQRKRQMRKAKPARSGY